MRVKNILLLLLLIATLGSAVPASARGRKKAKTHKVHKIRNTSSDDGGYYNGHKIYIGPRGGQYYINGNGRKTYIR
ncbi:MULTISPECIES: hypothetical protein [Chitinophagaceae]